MINDSGWVVKMSVTAEVNVSVCSFNPWSSGKWDNGL